MEFTITNEHPLMGLNGMRSVYRSLKGKADSTSKQVNRLTIALGLQSVEEGLYHMKTSPVQSHVSRSRHMYAGKPLCNYPAGYYVEGSCCVCMCVCVYTLEGVSDLNPNP